MLVIHLVSQLQAYPALLCPVPWGGTWPECIFRTPWQWECVGRGGPPVPGSRSKFFLQTQLLKVLPLLAMPPDQAGSHSGFWAVALTDPLFLYSWIPGGAATSQRITISLQLQASWLLHEFANI